MAEQFRCHAPLGEWSNWIEVASHHRATEYLIVVSPAKATVPVEAMVRYSGAEQPVTAPFSDSIAIMTANTSGAVHVSFRCMYMATDIRCSVGATRDPLRAIWRRLFSPPPKPDRPDQADGTGPALASSLKTLPGRPRR